MRSASFQRLIPFIVLPGIDWQRAHRHQAAGAASQDCDEKPEARHTGNSCSEILSHFICHICSKVTVDRVALSQLRTALGSRYVFRRARKASDLFCGKRPAAEMQSADQRAVDQKISVAADRAGEMRITWQREAEMADVVGTVFSLRLAS